MTTPRLELTAAVLAVRVDEMLKKELKIDLDSSVFWTDSMTVLKYIQNETKRFHTFVANRVVVIRDSTDVVQWRHIKSNLNPADEASRGLSAEEFLTFKRWLNGPEFLLKVEEEWPRSNMDLLISPGDPEVKVGCSTCVFACQVSKNSISQFLSYFSDFAKLKFSVAWMLKIKETLMQIVEQKKSLKASACVRNGVQDIKSKKLLAVKNKTKTTFKPLTDDDLMKAKVAIIQYCQQERFADEITALKSGVTVKRKSDIFKLNPVLENGLLRVGGRLARAAMHEEERHPVILSKDQNISQLILKHVHQQLGHAGRNYMLSSLRKHYWITNANSACRKIISDCVICRRLQGKVGEQRCLTCQ